MNRKVVVKEGWKRRYMYGLVRSGADQAQHGWSGGGVGCEGMTRDFGREWSVPFGAGVAPLHTACASRTKGASLIRPGRETEEWSEVLELMEVVVVS